MQHIRDRRKSSRSRQCFTLLQLPDSMFNILLLLFVSKTHTIPYLSVLLAQCRHRLEEIRGLSGCHCSHQCDMDAGPSPNGRIQYMQTGGTEPLQAFASQPIQRRQQSPTRSATMGQNTVDAWPQVSMPGLTFGTDMDGHLYLFITV